MRPDGQLLDLGTRTDQVYSYETDEGWQYHWAIAEATKRAEANGELSTISLSGCGHDRKPRAPDEPGLG